MTRKEFEDKGRELFDKYQKDCDELLLKLTANGKAPLDTGTEEKMFLDKQFWNTMDSLKSEYEASNPPLFGNFRQAEPPETA
ncbi:hypothetical protein FACS189499_10590 [Clostridia bacterium]|nr:hypothetical protein FACS189499_10590 [Clostridia bacterium]